ncbi:MAG: small multi-drug export protein [bacterium]
MKNKTEYPEEEKRLPHKKLFFMGISAALTVTILLIIGLVINSRYTLQVLFMIGACHLGGRLAFIGTGLEYGFSTLSVILIVMVYNTAFVLFLYSLFINLFEKISKFKFISSLHKKVHESRRIRSKWNLLSIAIFIWIPLPMTGGLVGCLLAYFEGYEDKDILRVALPSMWFGVISWAIAFDKLYLYISKLHPGSTIFITLFLIIAPILYNLLKKK